MKRDMTKIRTVAVDLAKHVFQAAGEDQAGKLVFEHRLKSRQAFYAFLRALPADSVVLMETGPGAQAWARVCQSLGVVPRILPAHRVKTHSSGAKNDRKDTLALFRANRDETIHPVPIKSGERLALQAMHRVRQGYIKRRTAITNQVRGLLLEQGVVLARNDAAIEQALSRLLEDAAVPIPDLLRELCAELHAEWRRLGQRLDALNGEIKVQAKADRTATRLMGIDGVGPITATAVLCKKIEPERFADSRQFAAYFGLVPDQHSSGEKVRLGHMTRRGDGYIRAMLIQGAHAVLQRVNPEAKDPDSRRLLRWMGRHGRKGAAVRLANRNLRVIWALLRRGSTYERRRERPAPRQVVGT